ncbi:MAG: MFS transporter, partial [Acidimicrobiales bacterium]
LFTELAKFSSPSQIPPSLLAEATRKVGLPTLLEANRYQSDLKFLQRVGPHLIALQKGTSEAPAQWQRWFWICAGGIVAFFPFIFLTNGRWSPARARRDAEDHERWLDEQLAAAVQAQPALPG